MWRSAGVLVCVWLIVCLVVGVSACAHDCMWVCLYDGVCSWIADGLDRWLVGVFRGLVLLS